jgi:hypothetical protein
LVRIIDTFEAEGSVDNILFLASFYNKLFFVPLRLGHCPKGRARRSTGSETKIEGMPWLTLLLWLLCVSFAFIKDFRPAEDHLVISQDVTIGKDETFDVRDWNLTVDGSEEA